MTYRFHNILFACLNDGFEAPAQLQEAAQLARLSDATMTVFDAVPSLPFIQRHIQVGDKRIDEVDFASSERRQQLQRWCDDLKSRRPMGVSMGTGRRSVAIAQRVREAQHDLVIVAPSGDANDLGVIRRLIRTVPCALLVLRNPCLHGTVVAGVDPEDELSMNAMIAMSAAGVGEVGGNPVRMVHAYQPHGVKMMRTANVSEATEERLAAISEQARVAHRAALDELVERIGLTGRVESDVEVGSPLEVLARTAVELAASVVVVGAGGRRGMPQVLIGSTAERVLMSTSLSLLIVKAPGFVPNIDDSADQSHGTAYATTPTWAAMTSFTNST